MKVGKTTLGSEMPKPLILAGEVGYNCLSGVYAQDITSWADMKSVAKELKKNEVKENFHTIVADTVDALAVLCEKYICAKNDVDSLNAIPYGQGWVQLKKEFEGVFRTITQLGYGVYFIAHEKQEMFKRPDGTEYTLIKPSVSTTYNSIIENMADIYGYMHTAVENGESKIKITLRSKDNTIKCGGRFKYIVPEIEGTYEALVKALNDAIDKEAEMKGKEFITEERNEVPIAVEINFDETMKRCENAIAYITDNTQEEEMNKEYAPKISQIIGMYLGKGKKLSQCTRDQGEMISLIADDLEKLVEEHKQKH